MRTKSQIVYIGSFPPPYGGVTVKNALLYKHLSSRIDIDIIDLSKAKKLDLRTISRLASCLISREGSVVLGVSMNWRRRLTDFLYFFNRKKMRQSYLFVMGGNVPDDTRHITRMGVYKHMYVETESMKNLLEKRGVRNVSVYPNCRERPRVPITIKSCDEEAISSVFFSLISPNKGVRIVLEAAKSMPQVSFCFYGRIEEGFAEEFLDAVARLDNVVYRGIFDSVEDDAVGELSKYDLHLFPTRCPNEGAPGVLVETKMAAVPSVVSDICYNAELVLDGQEGIVLEECTVEALCAAIEKLDADRNLLWSMKKEALDSAELFYIEKYIDCLVADLQEAAERTCA